MHLWFPFLLTVTPGFLFFFLSTRFFPVFSFLSLSSVDLRSIRANMLSTKTIGVLALSFTAGCRAATAMKQVESVSKAALVQQGWTVAQTPSAQEPITLQIGLSLQNTDKMIATLLDVSNRKSKNYGKWLDRDEVNDIVQPSKQANDAVVNWLKSEGVSRINSDGTWITFVSTVGTANRLLNAEFQQYQRDGVSKIRTTAYSVPEELVAHIDIIHPTTFFGKTAKFDPVPINFEEPAEQSQLEKRQQTADVFSTKQQKVSEACRTAISPACVKQLYNVGNYTPSATSGSKIGFGSFLNESASYSDLKIYLDYFKIPQQNFTKVPVNKGAIPKVPSTGESNLDVQNIFGVAYPLPVFEYLTAGSPPFIPDLEMVNASQNTNEPYVPYYRYLLSKKNSELPQVISNSYGDSEQTVPRRYAARTCQMIALMGLRGITILESSGDTGIGSSCRRNDGSNDPRFDSEFPNACPWVTSVGGTQVRAITS
jgi:tripeptidyl-peptidase-1